MSPQLPDGGIVLVCDMAQGCEDEVTHIDVKGWLYCTAHGEWRRMGVRCRKLRPAEVKRLSAGLTISYEGHLVTRASGPEERMNDPSTSNGAANASPSGFTPLRAALLSQFVEREAMIDTMLTAILAREHLVALGPPGTGKSALLRAIGQAVHLGYFEYLMTAFSTPEDVFGPVSVVGLQQDKFERMLGGYMASAQLVFLDEVFKANAAILNALLTILNERTYHNGGRPIACPLVTCIGASNELPEGGHTGELGALYDRFLVRLFVDPIVERDNFLRMLETPQGPLPRVALDLPREQAAAAAVAIGRDVTSALWEVRVAMGKQGMVASDRRWNKCQGVIRATAHLDGRAVAAPDDLGCLEAVLWNEPSERATVAGLIQQTVNPNAAKAVAMLDAAKALCDKLPASEAAAGGNEKYLGACSMANRDLKEIATKLAGLGTGRKVDVAKAEVAKLQAKVRDLSRAAMGVA